MTERIGKDETNTLQRMSKTQASLQDKMSLVEASLVQHGNEMDQNTSRQMEQLETHVGEISANINQASCT